MSKTERLTPLPHLIKSIRHRHWSLAGALMEWVDNSLQHGNAKTVQILIDNSGGIGIDDDGIGIDDINRVFTLGDASAYGDLSQIGQYGVGATDAMIWLGDKASVTTTRDGRTHTMAVNWPDVEASGLWPLRYKATGARARRDQIGTRILVTNLHQFYKLKTSENIAERLGLTFAPALRNGAKIKLFHFLTDSKTSQEIEVKPFTPADLTNETIITGTIDTSKGKLRWRGRAGLSASLKEVHNGVHIAFRHRVIEMTRDPFRAVSAPSLYVEVQLDETTPWKYALSDHKDRVVRHRDELVESIYAAIKPLLDKARERAENLALLDMIAHIEAPINMAIKAVGLLHYDPEEEAILGGQHGEEDEADRTKKQRRLHTIKETGEPANELPRPTGIKIEYVPRASLDGRAFTWDITDRLMTLKLEKEMFTELLEWPPKLRDRHVVHLLISFIAHAIDILYWGGEEKLRSAVTKAFYEQVETWAGQPDRSIAPYLYNHLVSTVSLR